MKKLWITFLVGMLLLVGCSNTDVQKDNFVEQEELQTDNSPEADREEVEEETEEETEIPEEKIFQFGVSYAMRKKRDSIIKRLSEKDMSERGVVRENPLIGRIPTRQEIMVELDELLMSM